MKEQAVIIKPMCDTYHFRNTIDVKAMLEIFDPQTIIMGNIGAENMQDGLGDIFDIETTITGIPWDRNSGTQLAVHAETNRQSEFSQNIISRITFPEEAIQCTYFGAIDYRLF